ncbi:polysaccharide lyase beta-sandwich domain-containing protein [Streptomyces sp. NPDC029674]|uniref:polysaccharide lyase beta-sandwich domain-containing protein n=1 Tax=Streptomyces sp. NPDC029674 TaxID=3365297 RepID=UPI0038502137
MTVGALGLTAANFWQAGEAGQLAATGPASVLVRQRGSSATVHVSQPPRTGEPLEFTWNRPVSRVVSKDPSVEVVATGGSLRLRVTPGKACASHRCEVSLS